MVAGRGGEVLPGLARPAGADFVRAKREDGAAPAAGRLGRLGCRAVRAAAGALAHVGEPFGALLLAGHRLPAGDDAPPSARVRPRPAADQPGRRHGDRLRVRRAAVLRRPAVEGARRALAVRGAGLRGGLGAAARGRRVAGPGPDAALEQAADLRRRPFVRALPRPDRRGRGHGLAAAQRARQGRRDHRCRVGVRLRAAPLGRTARHRLRPEGDRTTRARRSSGGGDGGREANVSGARPPHRCRRSS